MLIPRPDRRQLLAWLSLLALGCRVGSAEEELLVFAAASLRDACGELGSAFEAESGAPVVFSFAGSNLLARQIVAGAPCDVFLSAGESQVDEVERAGLLEPGTRFDLAGNTLVVVQPVPLPADVPPVRAAQDLCDERVGWIALAQPEVVPAGLYARAWLESVELWEQLAHRVVPAMDVRAALALVESGAAGAGVVYATDAAVAARARVVLRVPAAEGPSIVYPVAALARAGDPRLARDFVDFLRSPQARVILARHGFGAPAGG